MSKGFNHLGAAAASLERAVGRVVEKAVIDIAAGAAAAAPIDTGALAASYTWSMDTKTEGRAGSNIEYAPYQEFGTVHNAAQPHLLPAARRMQDALGRSGGKIMASIVEEAARHG